MNKMDPSKIKAVVFDCDGVMFDTADANRRFYNEVLETFHKPKHKTKSVIAEAKETLKIDHSEFLNFSLKYFECVKDKFDFNPRESDYFIVLINRIQDLCRFKTSEFYANRSSALRAHPIEWDDTTEDCFNLKNEDQLVDTPYQFELTANEYGRIHGFLIDNTFYIRWFDPEHNLYA